MGWVQIFVHATGVSASEMQRAEQVIERLGALVVSPPPAGIPVINQQGEYEVRLLQAGAERLVARMLTKHCGLTVTRTVVHQE